VVRIFLVLAALALALPEAVAMADFSIGQWRYVKSIQVPAELVGEGLVELPLDREVFGRAASGLVDLRVVEGEEAEVPYQLVVERGRQERQSLTTSIRDLGHVPGQYSSFVVDLDRNGVLHNEIEVLSGSRNFQREVMVEGSTDGATWAILQEESRIFDFTPREGDFTNRHTRVRYPESTARYLRVRIMNHGEEPLQISGASVFSVTETLPQERAYSATIISQTEDSHRRVSVMAINLGVERLPTSRLAVETSQVNFYRAVSLEASEDAQVWTPLAASDALYAYDTPRFVGRYLSVTYPETTSRYLRLTVHNEDNPPLKIQGVGAYGVSRKLLFAAKPGTSYTLYYGNPDATAPSYDLGRFLPYLETEDLPAGTLGPQAENPDFSESQVPLSERLPWLIPVVVALAAVAVGLLLFGVVKQARKVLTPPS
jgi:hypothetical protein